MVCQSGHGYEFRAISDPAKLYDVREPFGVNENNAASGVNELVQKAARWYRRLWRNIIPIPEFLWSEYHAQRAVVR